MPLVNMGYTIYTRPDGSTFSIRDDDGTKDMVLSYPENRGAVGVHVSEVTKVSAAGPPPVGSTPYIPPSPVVYAAASNAQNTGPSQSPVGASPSAGQTGGGHMGSIYRFILQSGPSRFDTGASYPTCSQSNTAGCQPAQFASLADAVAYAYAHGELPYSVSTVEEAWAMIAGTTPLDLSRVLPQSIGQGLLSGNTPLLIAGAAVLFLVLRKK